jgi:hypothetical protein
MDDQKSDCGELVRSSNTMNTKDKDAWYHCCHCGSLFQSDYGFDEDRLCEVCQRKPGVGLWPVVNSVKPAAYAKVASFHKTGDKVKTLTRTSSKKSRRFGTLLWGTLAWMLVLLGAVGLKYCLASAPNKPRTLGVADLDRSLSSSDKAKILDRVLPECDRALLGFLSASTSEARALFVFGNDEAMEAMEAHEKEYPLPRIDLKSLQRSGQKWMHLGDEWMVLTHWKEADGGKEFDAVFRKTFDGWKLDRAHFIRYSQASWRLFLAGEGELDQAEFRLLTKRVKDAGKSEASDRRMMIVLAATDWGHPKQAVYESPMISVDTMSPAGQMLKAAFESRESKLAEEALDPEGFVRVRARLTRDELGGEFRLILNELKACHWVDSDLPGF